MAAAVVPDDLAAEEEEAAAREDGLLTREDTTLMEVAVGERKRRRKEEGVSKERGRGTAEEETTPSSLALTEEGKGVEALVVKAPIEKILMLRAEVATMGVAVAIMTMLFRSREGRKEGQLRAGRGR